LSSTGGAPAAAEAEGEREALKIVLDTLGGDNPPQEIVQGGLLAGKALGVNILFAGDESVIQPLLPARDERFSILHAPEVVSMEDTPAEAVRRKKNSSLVQGIRVVRHGQADAFVSPANTGAVMAASLFGLGRISGIERPGIGVSLPTILGGQVLVIDVGANTDCSAENLLQFAIMGRVYAREVLGISEPRLALVNIGSEWHKGNELVKQARSYLEGFPGFIGNIEPNRLFHGEVDVAVCDGFVGNILLKAAEGGVEVTIAALKNALTSSALSKVGTLLCKPALRRFKDEINRAAFGGAPLLGVRGITIIAHGDSNAEAIKNAIRVACEAVQHDLVGRIESRVHEHLEQNERRGQSEQGAG